jgi:succinyl-diaminopimelate desuccinylase
MNRTLDLTVALAERRSLTPDDAGCQRLLMDWLAPLGFEFELIHANGVHNLWARRGRSSPVLCFAGHTDVVPSGPVEQWLCDPFKPQAIDGFLYGRGTADMKSGIAAFVTAVERFIAERPDHPGSIALLITSDEEGVAVDGTARIVAELQARGERLDYCLVGEPTGSDRLGDALRNGRRGSLSGTLVVKGIQGHIAYPALTRNPIHLVAPAIAALAETTWDEGNEYFPPTTWQISNIHGGTGATNVVPGAVEILFNFRFSTASTVESLKSRTHAVLDRFGFDYDLQWSLSGKPYLTPKGTLVDAVCNGARAVVGIAPALSTAGGTSDGRFIADICPQVVEFGHVNATIHKVNERVAIEDLESLSEIYRHILVDVLAQ